MKGLVRELAQEQADVALLKGLEAIRLRQSDVEDNHFVIHLSRKEYERAFVIMVCTKMRWDRRRRPVHFRAGLLAFVPPSWRPWTTG